MSEAERQYPIHSPKKIKEQEEAFKNKLATNSGHGHEALNSGNINPFEGYTPESLNNMFEFKLEFGLPTQKEIMERVVEPLKDISNNLGIEQSYPYDNDLPPHVTLEVAKFQNLTEEEKAKFFPELMDNTRLKIIADVLKGLDFQLDTAVTSGRDTYICTENFDNAEMGAFYKSRDIIARTMQRTLEDTPEGPKGLATVNYQDILHSTVGRITRLPEDLNALREYERRVNEEIAAPLRKEPIEAVIDNVYYGSPLTYHRKHANPSLREE